MIRINYINNDKKIFILLLFCIMSFSCMKDYPNNINNGGFERGNINNWSTFGNAFTEECISFKVKDENGNNYNSVGDFFFYGGILKNKPATGFMISEPFYLKGNGIIGFMIGAGKDVNKVFVALTDKTGEIIYAKRGNDEFSEGSTGDALHRVIIDGSDYIDQVVRIKIIDNDDGTGDFNYINVDDFIINYQGKEGNVGKVAEANNYIDENKDKVQSKYRMTYHLMPEIGWANDPNGFGYFNGKVHQFYQYNPYSSSWGTMHWGHATSTDFVKWDYSPVALAPDKEYDKGFGCFSGSSFVKDNEFYLFYTGVNEQGLQQQCVAKSTDGVVFKKLDINPIISSNDIPKFVSATDFRDPFVFQYGDYFYCLVGTRTNGYGQLVLFKSSNLEKWDYVGQVFNNSNPNEKNYYALDGVYECPTFAVIDGKQVLMCSPQNLKQEGNKYENIHSVVYMVGKFDFNTGRFHFDKMHEVDSGFDFYAAQLMTAPNGKVYMTAWMEMWDRTYPTQGYGWCGSMILPREVNIENNKLIQKPVKEIENYRINQVIANDINLYDEFKSIEGINGDTIELSFEIGEGNADKCGVKVFKGDLNETLIYYDANKKEVVIDRSNSGVRINGKESNTKTRSVSVNKEDKISIRIFLDKVSCEIFINDGKEVLSAKVYPSDDSTGIEFFSIGSSQTFKNINKYDIKVDK